MRTSQERPVANLDPSNYIRNSLIVSPNGRHIAYTLRSGDKQIFVADGQPGKPCDEVRYYAEGIGHIFSADSRRTFYYTRSGNHWHIVIDGEEEKTEFPRVPYPGRSIFSPGGLRTAHVAVDGDKQYMVLDGKPGPKYDAVSGPALSPGGKRLAYSILDGKKALLIVDDKRQKEYAVVGPPGSVRTVVAWPIMLYRKGNFRQLLEPCSFHCLTSCPVACGKARYSSHLAFSLSRRQMLKLANEERAGILSEPGFCVTMLFTGEPVSHATNSHEES